MCGSVAYESDASSPAVAEELLEQHVEQDTVLSTFEQDVVEYLVGEGVTDENQQTALIGLAADIKTPLTLFLLRADIISGGALRGIGTPQRVGQLVAAIVSHAFGVNAASV